MSDWPDTRIADLFGIDIPIIQAPMAGATTPEMVIAVSEAGGLGSLPSCYRRWTIVAASTSMRPHGTSAKLY